MSKFIRSVSLKLLRTLTDEKMSLNNIFVGGFCCAAVIAEDYIVAVVGLIIGSIYCSRLEYLTKHLADKYTRLETEVIDE